MNKPAIAYFLHVSSFVTLVLFATLAVFAGTHARAQETSEPHTADAVIAADEQWSKAEETGDPDYVNGLLLPEYRSISSDGSTHDKAAAVAHAAKNVGKTVDAAKIERWRAAHPYLPVVEVNGDVAILTFVLQKGDDPKPVMSCDIFVYRGGHWRALYSQHTEAGK